MASEGCRAVERGPTVVANGLRVDLSARRFVRSESGACLKDLAATFTAESVVLGVV